MMGHHLNMILPPSLGIEYEHLVDIEGDLEKTIKLDGTSNRDVRVIQPQICKMQYSRGEVAMHVLGMGLDLCVCCRPIDDVTYDAKTEIYSVAYERPALLREPHDASMDRTRISS